MNDFGGHFEIHEDEGERHAVVVFKVFPSSEWHLLV